MKELGNDVRLAMRMLVKRPGFTGIATLTLALGIGAMTAVFSVINGVLLSPLPYRGADRIVTIAESNPGEGVAEINVCPPNFRDWHERSRLFAGMAAIEQRSFNFAGSDNAERLAGLLASADFFSVFGAEMTLGRGFTADEDQPGHEKVVVLSHGLWQRRFGGAKTIVGKHVPLNGEIYTVIGVAAEGFRFPAKADLWAPIAFDYTQLARGDFSVHVMGRLKDGVTVDDGRRELANIASQLAKEYPDTNRGWTVAVKPLKDAIVSKTRPALFILMGAVALVLLIAITNVSSLTLASLVAREHELAIRQALGASRGRLIRLVITESIVLSLFGGIIGIGLAKWGTGVLVTSFAAYISRSSMISLNLGVVGFALSLSLLVGVACGLVPVLHLNGRTTAALAQGSRSATSGLRGLRLRRLLVAAEVALSLLLLVGATLLIRSFAKVSGVDPGFCADNILTARLDLPTARYGETPQSAAFTEQLMLRLQALPGVVSASSVDPLPMSGLWTADEFAVEGQPTQPRSFLAGANVRQVAPEYFATMQIRLLSGRAFEPTDRTGNLPVVVVNKTMAEKYLGGPNPIGKRITLMSFTQIAPAFTVVGVVEDVHWKALEEDPGSEVYLSAYQAPSTTPFIVVQSAPKTPGLADGIRRAVKAIDPELPVYGITPMNEILAGQSGSRRFSVFLLGLFSGVALLLTAVGIYGVLAFMVSMRNRELGIRAALGATRGGILDTVLRQGLTPVLAGVVCGIIGALAASRLLASQLFGVSATDPTSYASVVILVSLVAVLASVIPAWRATRVNPADVLRGE